jgi:hypothetical protein
MDFPGSPAGPATRVCNWHHGTSTTTRLVRVSASSSNSRGAALYACADCRTRHHLTPLDTLTPTQLHEHLQETAAVFLTLGSGT